MRERRGFTLIELLVVMTIIGVLAGLLLPAIAFAMERGRRAQCLSNCRQIGMILFNYADNHEGTYPLLVDEIPPGHVVSAIDRFGYPSQWPARNAFAILMFEGYLNDPRVLICPSSGDRMTMQKQREDFEKADLIDLVPGEKECSYGWDPTKHRGSASTIALVADKPNTDDHPDGTKIGNSLNHLRKGQNVFYNDGHVHWRETPDPGVGEDHDIYKGDEPFTGPPDYTTSNTDAKIIR